jgi:hypothetical protein
MASLLVFFLLTIGGILEGAAISVPTDLGSPDCVDIFCRGIVGDLPFPTEASFMAAADHRIGCATENFDPDEVKLGDTVFVQDWYLRWFLRDVHPQIKNQYVLISGDSDDFHPSPEARIIYAPSQSASSGDILIPIVIEVEY